MVIFRKYWDSVSIVLAILIIFFIILSGYFIVFPKWGLAITSTLFTFHIILYDIIKEKRYQENFIFEDLMSILNLLGLTILTWIIVMMQHSLVSGYILILITVIFIFILFTTRCGKWVYDSKKAILFILFYLITSFIIITLCAVIYDIQGELEYKGELVKENLTITDYYYFSTITFTTVGYGDIVPVGKSRITAMIEAYLGMAFNVAIIGVFLTRFLPKRKDNTN
ncbi:MAG: ion channel [Candidatus Pacearchaeota archaeon]|jgi:voltage-gated potassium channel Kch